jgi:hypothetical protein
MSHAMALDLLRTNGLWSVARGLARNVTAYKALLANCDLLGEEALVEFTRFFLKVSIDQVEFMEGLLEPGRLRPRIMIWAEEEVRMGKLPQHSAAVLDAILYRGELPRGDVPIIVGKGDRQARRIVSELIERGVVVAESPRAPLRLAFPATLASRWLPGLFPDQPQ